MTTSKKFACLANEYANIEEVFNKENLDNQKSLNNSKEIYQKTILLNSAKSMPLFTEFAKKYVKEPIGWQAGIRAATYYISKITTTKLKKY